MVKKSSSWREDIEKRYGSEVYNSGFHGEIIPTGSFIIDHLTGIGGFPCGRMVELFGSEGCGKSTISLSSLNWCLENKRSVLFLDYESTISDDYLVKLGIDTKLWKDYRITPDSLEDGFGMINLFCRDERNNGGIVILDSLAAAPTKHDMSQVDDLKEGEIGMARVGTSSGVISNAVRQMCGVLAKANVCLVFINQERTKISTGLRSFGPQITTPGGKAVKFYSSIRIQMSLHGSVASGSSDDLMSAKNVTAIRVGVKIIKNKFAPSYKSGEMIIRMDEGVDNLYSAILMASKMGTIDMVSKGMYELDEKYSGDTLGKKKIRGIENVRSYFFANENQKRVLLEDVEAFLKSNSSVEVEEKQDEDSE